MTTTHHDDYILTFEYYVGKVIKSFDNQGACIVDDYCSGFNSH